MLQPGIQAGDTIHMPHCHQAHEGTFSLREGSIFHLSVTLKARCFFELCVSVSFCVFRPSSGSFAVGGSGNAKVCRRTTTIAAIRAPTTHPSWVAANRRCPLSAPARDAAPLSPAPRRAPPPPTKTLFLAWKEEEGQSRCRRLLRMVDRWQGEGWQWMGRAHTKTISMEPPSDTCGPGGTTHPISRWHKVDLQTLVISQDIVSEVMVNCSCLRHVMSP